MGNLLTYSAARKRGGGVAVGGAGAAGGPRATHRRARRARRERSYVESSPLRVHSSACDLGWTDGRNVRIELRFSNNDINRIRALTQELVGMQPDIYFAMKAPDWRAHSSAYSPPRRNKSWWRPSSMIRP
jgi:hypothetical protein